MRWWIVEDALRGRQGHWFEYLRTFQRGLVAQGDQVHFFASKECESEIAAVFKAETVLPKSIWARMSDGAPKWRRLLRIPAHGLATYRAISKLLADFPAPHAPGSTLPAGRAMPDLIFVPTVLVHHLVGWIPLIKAKLRNTCVRVLLFFPNAPVDVRGDGTAYLLPDPTAKLFRICIRSLAKEVASGKVILGAETRPMVKALSEVTGVPFTYLPHPVECAATQAPDTRNSLPATPERPIRFGCYGAARYEKGSDVLQAAIRFILERDSEIPACFSFQWLGDFHDEQGKVVTLDPWLSSHPKVDTIRHVFPEGGYERQLAQTDVMVLPYRRPYRLRVSRVVIEAMNSGMPIIATRDTTLMEQAEEFGAAEKCEQDSANDLARAMLATVEQFSRLRESAMAKAKTSRNHFSVCTFRKALLVDN
jgi:glycosyltransferase involved in cell wall biosynthesis